MAIAVAVGQVPPQPEKQTLIAIAAKFEGTMTGLRTRRPFAVASLIFVHNNFGPALVHFLPLAGLETYRIWKNLNRDRMRTA